MKKIILLIGIVILLALTAGGSFWGGMQYQTQRSEQIRADFFTARGQTPQGGVPGQMPGFPQGDLGEQPGGQAPGGFGGNTIGVIKTIEGNVLTISTAQDVSTVTLSENSQVNQTVTVSISELQPGMRISVRGQEDAEGSIVASIITILATDTTEEP